MRAQPATARRPIRTSGSPDPADESGFALVLALGILIVLSISLSTAIYYASSSVREANYDAAGQSAFALAEAGINDALSILAGSQNPAAAAALPSCAGLLTPTAASTGSYTFCGSVSGLAWTIDATGTARNPTGPGAAPVTRRLTRTATLVADPTIAAWDRIDNEDPTSPSPPCWDVPYGTIFRSNVSSKGNVCLTGAAFTGSTIGGSATRVQIGGTLTLTQYPAPSSSTGYASVGGGDGSDPAGQWADPGNVSSTVPGYATTSAPANGTSVALTATAIGGRSSSPINAVPAGIEVQVYGMAAVPNALTATVQLLQNGIPVGHPESGGTWGSTIPASPALIGSATDLWGAPWTRADTAADGFGVRLVVTNATGAPVLASVDKISVTVVYDRLDSSVGLPGAPMQEADIAGAADGSGACSWNAQPWSPAPCSELDHVYGSLHGVTAPAPKPTVSFDYWYAHAAPGPMHPCDVRSGTVPAFDNNTTYTVAPYPGEPNPDPANGLNASQEITPQSGGYTCVANDASGRKIGELSWDPVTRVLTISGTVFFDGPITFNDQNTLVRYSGRGTIYASGAATLREAICAGGTGLQVSDCMNAATFSSWDPAQNLLLLVLGGKTTTGTDDCHLDKNTAAFQGAIWAQDDCRIGGSNTSGGAWSSGPILAQRVTPILNTAPQFFSWQPLVTPLPGMSADGSISASGFTVLAGTQLGG